ncbi:hypothetical protein BC938DRAFT_478315 [Jimgerdemannia flammicorona]|uniref:Uncharacterized protein n=1 Tax=Jimgerdemannia flammicorona TaxID=994334 RepID=A0A433QN21_9FUNG|nr:hypothetical protein BC938DRAFT_478315 [Jimgerdemannia flammicorona]
MSSIPAKANVNRFDSPPCAFSTDIHYPVLSELPPFSNEWNVWQKRFLPVAKSMQALDHSKWKWYRTS